MKIRRCPSIAEVYRILPPCSTLDRNTPFGIPPAQRALPQFRQKLVDSPVTTSAECFSISGQETASVGRIIDFPPRPEHRALFTKKKSGYRTLLFVLCGIGPRITTGDFKEQPVGPTLIQTSNRFADGPTWLQLTPFFLAVQSGRATTGADRFTRPKLPELTG